MNKSKVFWRRLSLFFLITAICGMLAIPAPMPVRALPTSILISQVYGGGGNSGATYTNDFVELFNPTNASIPVTGWSIQYAGGTTVGLFSASTTTLSGSLAPGQYYLVQLASGGAVGSALPLPIDASGTTNMSATNGKVALVNSTTGLACNGSVAQPCTASELASIVDLIGYGTANFYEGTGAAPAGSNTTADIRTSNGCIDTDNNNADFAALSPTPRNTGSPVNICPLPTVDIIINEVAWAGTAAFAGDEWIELYNSGTGTATLNNWRIEAADGTPSISLDGLSIGPNSYLLLERGSPNVTNVTGTVYPGSSGVLSDTGETLYLLNEVSAIVSTANSNGGAWPAGDGSPNFRTMERTGNVPDSDVVWLTFDGTPSALDAASNLIYGTPGSANWAFGLVPTASPTVTLTPSQTFTPTQTFTPSPTFTFTPTNTFTPSPTITPVGFMSVIINEVAWAGTAASSSDEWIELYNPGATPINLSTGWVLKALDGTPTISLTGSIPAGGYYLLERTDNTSVSDITADLIFSGDVSNSGETFQLFDPSNRLIDTANGNGGAWPAGSSTTFGSMERSRVIADSDTAWFTNTGVVRNGLDANGNRINGTPKQANWATTVTATPSPLPTSSPRPTSTRTATPLPPPELLAINEFVPRPGRDWNNDGQINTGDEFIELINHGTIPVNLSGWTLDDEANIGSSPFGLPSTVLQPGERIVFYGSRTNLLLSDGGDGVRLLKPNGSLIDAFNYTVAGYPDQSFCRLPDNGGLDDWNQNCFPTPGLGNSVGNKPAQGSSGNDGDFCPVADTLPLDFFLAECDPFGHNIWSRFYWDDTGWFGEKELPDSPGKWAIFVD